MSTNTKSRYHNIMTTIKHVKMCSMVMPKVSVYYKRFIVVPTSINTSGHVRYIANLGYHHSDNEVSSKQ